MRVLVTGATGFVGRRLLAHLDDVVVLSRDPDRARALLAVKGAVRWDATSPPPQEAFDGVEAVVHLAGESVARGRWTAAKKQSIHDSRVQGTKYLVDGISRLASPPRVLVSASAVGFYGSRGDEVLDESSAPGADFLADVCRGWEEAALRAHQFGVRVVLNRLGVVLDSSGGALKQMLLPFKLGLGGRLGDGRQWMPWVHLDDAVGLILHGLRKDISGPMNVVAPEPVRNAEFTRALATAIHRPAVLPVPGFGLRLAVGEFAQVLLGSQRAVPRVAERSGYKFVHPRLPDAIAAICGNRSPAAAAATTAQTH